jgi:SAM-dependent methyltransferase
MWAPAARRYGGPVRERRLTFGEVAELYDRARPSYPAPMVQDVVSSSGASRALEVGAGTGKATVLFAQLGVSVLALEPSAEMAAVARRQCSAFPAVRVEELEFEVWDPAERFPLLFSAQAWHWVKPSERYRLARAALSDGGLLAAFWNRVSWGECILRDPLSAAYDGSGAALTPGDAMDPRRPPATDWPERWKQEIDEAVGFHAPETRVYHWTQVYSGAEYVALLSTHSAQLIRDAPAREALLGAVGEVVAARGGHIAIPYVTELCLARATS